MARDTVTVRVPATSGNLGAGFDVLGLALDIFNTMQVSRSDRPGFTVRGEGAGQLSAGLVRRAIAAVFEATGQPMPPLAICEDNAIPVGKGLGSSA
ncbi:MAG: homoserine kinase, partial [Chloroflexi bacterium]|nr:homoserine kinase [Chloroflexota bacterium]